MCSLLKNVTNSIWHAFNFLTTDSIEIVYKSKLKVLTANIGSLLDLYGVEKGLDHFRSTAGLNFEHFIFYLDSEMFHSCGHHLGRSQFDMKKYFKACYYAKRKVK